MPIAVPRKPSGMLEAEQQRAGHGGRAHQAAHDAAAEFDALRNQVEFSVTSEGLRIELVDETQSSFFDSGSSVLRGESDRAS